MSPTDLLLHLRWREGLLVMMADEARKGGLGIESPLFQHSLSGRVFFKQNAHLLPPRQCSACGLVAADAADWGHPIADGEQVCTLHRSAWV